MINMEVNGGLELTILNLEGQEIDSETNVTVLEKLKNGTYFLDLKNKTILDGGYYLDPNNKPILNELPLKVRYNFNFEVGDYTEYEFSDIDEDC